MRGKLVLLAAGLVLFGSANASAQNPVPVRAPGQSAGQFFRADSLGTDSAYRMKKSSVRISDFQPQSAQELDAYIRGSKGYLFVEFGTPWCGPCKAMARDLPSLMEQTLSIDGEYLSLYATDGRGLQESAMVGARGMRFEEESLATLLSGATRAGNVVQALGRLKSDGDSALVTFDGSRYYWAVLDGRAIRVFKTNIFATGGSPNPSVPFCTLFLDGKPVVRGATYPTPKGSYAGSVNMCQGIEVFRWVLQFIEENGRGPTHDELPGTCNGIAKTMIARP
jgi:thiol-disulfide isomerase/thioredoxin